MEQGSQPDHCKEWTIIS